MFRQAILLQLVHHMRNAAEATKVAMGIAVTDGPMAEDST